MTSVVKHRPVTKEVAEDWLLKASIYLDTADEDSEDYHYWAGFVDALGAVLGYNPGLL